MAKSFDDNANMIALQWVSYYSPFDFVGGKLNTDMFKGFEANIGFVVVVTVRNTVYEYSKIVDSKWCSYAIGICHLRMTRILSFTFKYTMQRIA